MTSSDQRYLIVKGPSREDLFDALRLKNERREVTFHARSESDTTLIEFERVLVQGITDEDGSGESWNVELYNLGNPLALQHLEGHYNTTSRKGFLIPAQGDC